MKHRFGPPPEGYVAGHDGAEAQTRTLSIPVNLRIVPGFQDDPDVIARVYYPEEGNEIHIIKGLNRLEFDRAVLHELSHLFDWYLGEQSAEVSIREACACNIAGAVEHAVRPK
jgi:hypothetical protein